MAPHPSIALLGFVVGLLVGATGVGGGSLMTPALILGWGVAPLTAIGTDLACGALTRALGGWRHWRQGTVDRRLCGALAAGSLPAATIAVVILERLHHSTGRSFDHKILGVVSALLVLCGLVLLGARLPGLRMTGPRAPGSLMLDEPHDVTPPRSGWRAGGQPLGRRRRGGAIALGALAGLLVSATSTGAGALVVGALAGVFRLRPREAVGTDVLHGAWLAAAAALAYLIAGDVDLELAGMLLLGSLPGVWLGSRVSGRIPDGTLYGAIATMLIDAGLALMRNAGAGIPMVAIEAVPVLALCSLATARLRGPAPPRR